MSTIIDEPPLIGDNKRDFNRKAFKSWGQLSIASVEWSLGLANLASAVATVTSGLAADLWVTGTAYAVGNLRFDPSDGLLYRRLTAGAGSTRPGLDPTNWALQTLPDPTLVVVSSAAQAAVAGPEYLMTNAASSELTLPAAPVLGDVVRVSFGNGRVDNWVRRNGQLIIGRSEDMLINIPYWARRLRFAGGAIGWAVLR